MPWLIVLLMNSPMSSAQEGGLKSNRVNLDDVQIQGELLSDDRLRWLARSRNSIADEIKIRSSFREEILEGLPEYFRAPTSN